MSLVLIRYESSSSIGILLQYVCIVCTVATGVAIMLYSMHGVLVLCMLYYRSMWCRIFCRHYGERVRTVCVVLYPHSLLRAAGVPFEIWFTGGGREKNHIFRGVWNKAQQALVYVLVFSVLRVRVVILR